MQFLRQPLATLFMVLILVGTAHAQPPDGDYDPFADSNRVGAKPVTPNPPTPGAKDKRVLFAVDFPKTARPGEVVKLTITGTPQGKYYTYPMTKRTPDELKTMLCRISFDESPGLIPIGQIEETQPTVKNEDRSAYLIHKKPFTWTQDILVQPTGPGSRTLKFKINYQACDTDCKWDDYSFETTIAVSGESIAVPAPVAGRGNEKRRVQLVPPPDTVRSATPLVKLTVDSYPKNIKAGQWVTVTINGEAPEGVLVFPISRRSPDQREVDLSKVQIQGEEDVIPTQPLIHNPASFKLVNVQGEKKALLGFSGSFTWAQSVHIPPNTRLGKLPLAITVDLGVFNDGKLTKEKSYFFESVDVQGPPVEVSDADAATLKVVTEITVEPVPESVLKSDEDKRAGLEIFLVAAAVAAFFMVLTPCVFPMIPITVSFFLKQSEKEHHNALMTAAVYSLTIIVVLTASVFILGTLIIRWANDAWMNLALGGVLGFFALSLLGMYEIELPSFLSRFTSQRESKGGYVGAIFMALTFTITSFTCTGPFLGPLLVGTAEFRPSQVELILGALVYSTVFAAPFFVLALFPGMLRKLPKSGGWMNNIKVVFGFLELAAALKFLAVTDNALNPGDPGLFNYDTVLCAWIALSAMCGLYLLGMFRLPHDGPPENIGVVRMMFASLFLGLTIYMVPLLSREIPLGGVGRNLKSFLPFDTKAKKPVVRPDGTIEKWHRDYEEAWQLAVKENKLIFIDFTGVNCTNCRYNEDNVFPDPDVQSQLHKYVLVQLYTDSVPNPRLSKSEAEVEAKRNAGWQEQTFGDISNPLYIVLKPDPKEAFKNDKLNGTELGRRSGQIRDVREFADFLRQFQRK